MHAHLSIWKSLVWKSLVWIEPCLEKPCLERNLINQQDADFYKAQGYLVVENVLNQSELAALRSDLKKVVANASSVTENNDVYDLEDTHSPDNPRVRRIKDPHRVMPVSYTHLTLPTIYSV